MITLWVCLQYFHPSGQRQYHVPGLIGLRHQEKPHSGIILGSPVYFQNV